MIKYDSETKTTIKQVDSDHEFIACFVTKYK